MQVPISAGSGGACGGPSDPARAAVRRDVDPVKNKTRIPGGEYDEVVLVRDRRRRGKMRSRDGLNGDKRHQLLPWIWGAALHTTAIQSSAADHRRDECL